MRLAQGDLDRHIGDESEGQAVGDGTTPVRKRRSSIGFPDFRG